MLSQYYHFKTCKNCTKYIKPHAISLMPYNLAYSNDKSQKYSSIHLLEKRGFQNSCKIFCHTFWLTINTVSILCASIKLTRIWTSLHNSSLAQKKPEKRARVCSDNQNKLGRFLQLYLHCALKLNKTYSI